MGSGLAFVFGLFVGVAIGLLTIGLCSMASKRDEHRFRGPLLRYDRGGRHGGRVRSERDSERDEAWVAGVGVRRRGEGW